MGVALGKLAQHDPSFRAHRCRIRPDHHRSRSELALDIIVDRMRREFKVQANIGKPRVAYRETIRTRAESEGKFVRQFGGRGQYGHVKLKIEPLTDAQEGQIYEFVDEIVGGVIPREYIPAVNKGIQEQMKNCVLAGYPLINVRARLVDGSFHEVDSSKWPSKSRVRWRCAGVPESKAVAESIMRSVDAEDYMGRSAGDLNRRGRGSSSGWVKARPARSCARMFRSPRCLDIRRTCDRYRRAARTIRWSFRSIRLCPTASLRGSSKERRS